ncbi:MAG TPA: hypothetical protein VFB22_17150 [Candidatus Baltobacteraceae bacterium]|nr:hypothetical protein [Candidatus Baltobacteraceae bacterium]
MIDDDFDDLDRALAALPLEAPPPSLHARIMAATVYRPQAVARPWELWLTGTLVAICAWLVWLVVSAPHATERIGALAVDAVQTSGLTSMYTLLWLAVGASAAWWISQLSVPQRAPRTQSR